MGTRNRPGLAGAIVVLALGSTGRLAAHTLDSLDLASLYREAELIVLVENFKPGEKNRAGIGVVKKVFKGDFNLGGTVAVTPWAVDFKRVSGVPGGKLDPEFTAVFFLKRQSRHRCWETVFSGVRILIEDKVFAVRPQGPSTYGIVPAKPELLKDPTPYNRARFQRDLNEAKDRVYQLEQALLLRPTEEGLKKFTAILETELRRAFATATRSGHLLELAGWLAETGELETLWNLRSRVPKGTMRREVNQIFTRVCTYEFIAERLGEDAGSKRFAEMLDFLAAVSFSLRSDVKLEALENLINKISSFNERVGTQKRLARAYETAAAVYDNIATPIGEDLLLQVVELAKTGGPLARYHLRPALFKRQPILASREFDEPLRIFALVHPETTTRKSLGGRVKFRRLVSGQSFEDPQIIFQRRTTDGQTLDHYFRPIALPAKALRQGKSGDFVRSFSWNFKRNPLASGEWRMLFTVTYTTNDQQRVWSTEPVKFRIRD